MHLSIKYHGVGDLFDSDKDAHLDTRCCPQPRRWFCWSAPVRCQYTICVQIQEALGWAVLFIVVVQCNMYCGGAGTVL